MSLITDEIRAKATELHHGNEECLGECKRLLREMGLPNGLIPLQEVEETGYVEETGFVWLKQKKEIKHTFDKIGKQVSFAKEVTAYVEECKIKKLTGVKAKEFFLWVTVNEITIDAPESEKILFKNNATGISRQLPASAFVVEEAEEAAAKGPVGSLKFEKAANEKKEEDCKVVADGVVNNNKPANGVEKEVAKVVVKEV